jgi:hypothetical protein
LMSKQDHAGADRTGITIKSEARSSSDRLHQLQLQLIQKEYCAWNHVIDAIVPAKMLAQRGGRIP